MKKSRILLAMSPGLFRKCNESTDFYKFISEADILKNYSDYAEMIADIKMEQDIKYYSDATIEEIIDTYFEIRNEAFEEILKNEENYSLVKDIMDEELLEDYTLNINIADDLLPKEYLTEETIKKEEIIKNLTKFTLKSRNLIEIKDYVSEFSKTNKEIRKVLNENIINLANEEKGLK